jgi:hypothetical protein
VRITVWQPYFAGCMLAFGPVDAAGLDILEGDTELQKELFTWPIEEDVWAGVTDDNLRAQLEERFVTDFQPMKLPPERSMAKFADFVAAVGAVVRKGSEWSAAASGVAEHSPTTCMTNALLAFHEQLHWMLEMFRDLPGASVSVR